MSPLAYYVLFYSLFFGLLTVAYRYRHLADVCRPLVWLLLTLFSGLRVGVGRDYMVYVDIYTNVHSPSNSHIEPLWNIIINPIFRYFDLPLHIWLICIAGLTYFFVFYGLKKWRIDWIWGVLCYVLIYKGFFESMNTVRQTLASAIVFAGAYHLLDRRYLRFVPWMLFGYLFHSSALIGGLILMITSLRLQPRWLYLGLGASLIMGLFFFPWFIEMLKYLDLGKYALYLEGGYHTEWNTGLYRVFLCAFALFLIASLRLSQVQHSPRLYLYTQMLIFSIFIYNALYIFEPGVRLMLYPFTAVFFVFPLYWTQCAGWFRRVAMVFFLGLCVFSFKTLFTLSEPYVNYQTVFDLSLPLPDVPRATESPVPD